jgi:hypothetical protein
MIIVKKKDVLQELAVSLFLMLRFDADTTALSLVKRIRERAEAALKDAAAYTGPIAEKDVEEFLKSKSLRFAIHCGRDILKGDTIRFIEMVFDNRQKPSRQIGKRGITAEVLNIYPTGNNPMLDLRVIASGGVWDLKPDTEIHRTLKIVTRIEVMRVAWDDEAKREKLKLHGGEILDVKAGVTTEILTRDDSRKTT